MNITKRDIADIALVWIAVSFVFGLLNSFLSLGAYIGMSNDAMQYTDRTTAIVVQIVHLFLQLFITYTLLFRRSVVLSLLFPDAKDKALLIPEGITALTSYSFWVRLFGLFVMLNSSVSFFGWLVSELLVNREFNSPFMMGRGISQLVSAILAFLVIWKADWISTKLENLKKSNQPLSPSE